MSRNGSGIYTLPPGINPVTQDTTITSNWANTTLADIAAALTQSLARDGQTVPVANLPMGGFRHTGVGNPTARNQYASLGWVQDGNHIRLTSVGGTNAISAQLVGNPTTLQIGQLVQLTPAANNTGNVTLNIGSIGPKPVVRPSKEQLGSGELKAGFPYLLAYDGSQFIVINFDPPIDASDVVSGVFDLARIPVLSLDKVPDLPASKITSGTLPVARGGTGQSSLTSGSYLRGNGTGGVQTRTPAQVLSDIGAASLEANTFSNTQTIRGAGNSSRMLLFTNNQDQVVADILGNGGGGMSLGGGGNFVRIRPNGVDSANGQVHIDSSGDMTVSGSVTASGFQFSGGPRVPRTFVQSSDPGSSAQNGDLWVW